MNILKEKIIELKQKRCIKAIKYLTSEEVLKTYYEANKIIDSNYTFAELYGSVGSLYYIRRYYQDQLEEKKKYYMKQSGCKDTNLFIYKPVRDLTKMLETLSDEFIAEFGTISFYIRYIEKNNKYLTAEQQNQYLLDYYRLIGNNDSYDKIKVRSVK